MKPLNAIIANINVPPIEVNDDCLSFRVDIVKRRRDITKTHIARFALMAAFVLLCPETQWATYVVIVEHDGVIVIGADSKVSHALSGTATTECKIHEVRRGIFFAAAGLYARRSTGFDVAKIAVLAGTKATNVQRMSTRFVQSASHPLQESAIALRKIRPDYFSAHYGGGVPILWAAFVGYQKGMPIIIIHYFFVSFDEQGASKLKVVTHSCPGDCPPGNDAIIELGDSKPAQVFVANHPTFWSVGQVEGVRQLLDLTIRAVPEDVGLPVSILQIGNAGSTWIEKGACK